MMQEPAEGGWEGSAGGAASQDGSGDEVCHRYDEVGAGWLPGNLGRTRSLRLDSRGLGAGGGRLKGRNQII